MGQGPTQHPAQIKLKPPLPNPSTSTVQNEAIRQARLLYQDVEEYRRILPHDSFHGGSGICRADGWNLSFEQLDGDFDLDEVLARNLVAGALSSSKGPSLRSTPSPAARTAAPRADGGSWLEQYFLAGPTGDVGSSERIGSEMKNVAVGPGNVLGNAVQLKQAANAMVQTRTGAALQAAARTIESGAAKTVKINPYMTLYNANKSGKGRPRPRLRITGMPMQVVTPALGPGARLGAFGASGAMRMTDTLKAQKLGALASDAHWTGKAAFLNGKIGGGILTFAPSAALDVYNSIEWDLGGDWRFNRQTFVIASAKSQSGNLMGLVGGAVVAFAVAGTFTAAPVILIGLGTGYLVQVIWGATGMADRAGAAAERALKP